MTAPCPEFRFLLELRVTSTRPGTVYLVSSELRALLRARGLECDGQTTGARWSVMIRSEASQVTDEDRRAVRAWAASRPDVADVRVGELVDVRS